MPFFQRLPNFDKQVISNKEAVQIELAKIHQDLTLNLLEEVIFAAMNEVSSSLNGFYPLTSEQVLLQLHLAGKLREKLAWIGWTQQNSHGGGAWSVSPDKRYAITTFAGDKDTGKIEGCPSNRASKGNTLKSAIYGELEGLVSNTTILILLFYKEGNQIWAELSTPQPMSGRQISGWIKRILLPLENFSLPEKIKISPKSEIDSKAISIKRRKKQG